MPEPMIGARPPLEVADVIKSHGEAFLQKYGSHLTATQKKALRALASPGVICTISRAFR